MQEIEGVIKYQLHHKTTGAIEDISLINRWRSLLYQLKLIGQQPERYLGYGYGNISQRYQNEQFIISGTQTGGIAELSAEHYCLVEKVSLSQNTLYASGPCQPSSEALSHASVYAQNPRIQCVIHAHSPEIWNATQTLKLSHTTADIPYGTPEMAVAISQLFASGQLEQQTLFTMLGHEDGVISFGESFPQAALVMIRALIGSS